MRGGDGGFVRGGDGGFVRGGDDGFVRGGDSGFFAIGHPRWEGVGVSSDADKTISHSGSQRAPRKGGSSRRMPRKEHAPLPLDIRCLSQWGRMMVVENEPCCHVWEVNNDHVIDSTIT